MDYSNTNIIAILKASIENRFQDFSPQDFEDFIVQEAFSRELVYTFESLGKVNLRGKGKTVELFSLMKK